MHGHLWGRVAHQDKGVHQPLPCVGWKRLRTSRTERGKPEVQHSEMPLVSWAFIFVSFATVVLIITLSSPWALMSSITYTISFHYILPVLDNSHPFPFQMPQYKRITITVRVVLGFNNLKSSYCARHSPFHLLSNFPYFILTSNSMKNLGFHSLYSDER